MYGILYTDKTSHVSYDTDEQISRANGDERACKLHFCFKNNKIRFKIVYYVDGNLLELEILVKFYFSIIWCSKGDKL